MKAYKFFHNRQLQDWYTIQIDRSGESVEVTFCSRIHVNKEVKCSITFSHDFSDSEILRDSDLYGWVTRRYGSDIFAGTY